MVDVAAVRCWWQRPASPLLILAAVSLSLHLATNGLYGFHTDEFYYIESVTSVDGAAGAIDIYGPREHLPQAISPHLNIWYWRPAHLGATTLVTVGYLPSDLAFLCGSVTRAGTVTVPYSIVNLEQGAPILVCTNLRESINVAWPRLKNFS